MIPSGFVDWARVWADLSGDRFDDSARLAFLHAIDEARARGHKHLGVEHLFAGCIRSDPGLARSFGAIADPLPLIEDAMRLSTDPEQLEPEPPIRIGSAPDTWERLERAHHKGHRVPPVLTPRAVRVLERAEVIASGTVAVTDLMYAVVEEPNSVIAGLLHQRGIGRGPVDAWLRARAEWAALVDLAKEVDEGPSNG